MSCENCKHFDYGWADDWPNGSVEIINCKEEPHMANLNGFPFKSKLKCFDPKEEKSANNNNLSKVEV